MGEYTQKPLDAIGVTAKSEPVIDADTGVVLTGTPLTVAPEPKEGSLDAAILKLRRLSDEDSPFPKDWL